MEQKLCKKLCFYPPMAMVTRNLHCLLFQILVENDEVRKNVKHAYLNLA